MSVLVRGMKMPKTCDDCTISCDHDAHIDGYKMVKPSRFCPLIELPPHGDLIDRDALLTETRNLHVDVLADCVYVKISTIEDAPTIIEAEEDE